METNETAAPSSGDRMLRPPVSEPLSKLSIVRAATNDPALSERKIVLGDRTFPIVDLAYDHYILFLAQLQPLLVGILGSIPGIKTLGLTSTVTPTALIAYCGASLPEMARIVCAQTDPEITVVEVKLLGKTPFKLAELVLAQIEQNHIINDIRDFFVQLAPLLKLVKR